MQPPSSMLFFSDRKTMDIFVVRSFVRPKLLFLSQQEGSILVGKRHKNRGGLPVNIFGLREGTGKGIDQGPFLFSVTLVCTTFFCEKTSWFFISLVQHMCFTSSSFFGNANFCLLPIPEATKAESEGRNIRTKQKWRRSFCGKLTDRWSGYFF